MKKLPTGILLGKTLRELHWILQRKTNQSLAQYDLTVEHLRLLTIISEYPGSEQNILAEKTRRGKSATTKLITVMGKNGLLARVPSPQDGRAKLIYPTSKGEELLKMGTQSLAKMMNDVFADDEQQMLELVRQLEELIRRLE